MKISFVLALGMLTLSCGGGSGGTLTATEACPMISEAACAKIFSCSEAQLLIAQAVLMSQQACVTTIEPSCPTSCASGQTYHGDKAKECLDAAKAAQCSTIAANISTNVQAIITAVAPVCNEICTN